MPEFIPEKDGHSSADKGHEAGRSLYEDALPTSSKPQSSTHAPTKLTRAEYTSSGDVHGVGSANERTTVRLQDGDTLWDLAQEKYKGQPSLGAIYQANGLTPQVVTRNGRREFVAPICYTGKAYILPAQQEIPTLESLFKQRMGLATITPKPHVTGSSASLPVPRETTTQPRVSSGDQKKDNGMVDFAAIGQKLAESLASTYKQAEDFITEELKQFQQGLTNKTKQFALDTNSPEQPPEVPPPRSIELFPGSYYIKEASSWDPEWAGITAVVTLGTPHLDPNRVDKTTSKPLDGFTIYMGGNAAGQEIDAGLSWEPTVDKSGKVSQANRAWRPFWLSGKWDNAPAKEELYWHPGDTVSMSVRRSDKPGWLKLTISDVGPHPKRSFTTEFKADNFSTGVAAQFKTVTALDQSMGSNVTPTRSTLVGTTWHQTHLLRGTGSTIQQLPLTESRRAELISHKESIVVSATASQQAAGGKTIDISGLTQAY
ncbi:MAG: LysM peptidoglycan-binding domain-containing protein [Candidatus Melainabacteria bacterium]|nr:LysM peptidoglycan-binding domain-containing protein [Candidatus Melainabacteria bacterium]